MRKEINLYEDIMNLRAQAALLYEMSLKQGVDKEEINKQLKSVTAFLEGIITGCAEGNVDECAKAIIAMDNNIESFEKSIAYYRQKISDEKQHQDSIKQKLIMRMIREDIKVFSKNGFMIAMVDDQIIVK